RNPIVANHFGNSRTAPRGAHEREFAVELDLDLHAAGNPTGRRPQLERLLAGGSNREALVGLDQIGVPAACGPMPDHAPASRGNQTSAQVRKGGSTTASRSSPLSGCNRSNAG